jgi:muconate cycloisomerase
MVTAALHHLRIPFRRPFGHVLATRDHAEAIVLVINDGEGNQGVGECVPREYVTGESFASVWTAITGVRPSRLWGALDASTPARLVETTERLALPVRLAGFVPGLAAACCVELALLDLACRRGGWPLAELAFASGVPAGLLTRTAEREVISIPLDFQREPADLAHFVGSQLGNLKIKVGADPLRDVQRVRECRQLFRSTVTMSIDANMAWSFDDAMRAADSLARFDIGWFEEPLQPAHRHRYSELRERAGIRVMLDEAACGYTQTTAAIAAGACDLINIRLSKCGGFLASLRLAAFARAASVGYQHGTQVGQLGFLNAAGRQLTSVVRDFVACEGGPGLANLTDFPTTTKVALDWGAGHLVGLDGNGIGVAADPEKLARYAIHSATYDGARWETRT